MSVTTEHLELATRDASLGVGHIWTAVQCPAYGTYNPADCVCRPHVDTRRMTAVTIAISEPADSAEIDWAGVVASIVRTTFNAYDGDPGDTGVRVIDSWRADQ